MFLQQVFETLNHERVRYVVVGGVAVNLWGIQRSTHDLDLVVDLRPGNLRALVGALGRLGLLPRVPVDPMDLADARKRNGWIRSKGLLAFTFFDPRDPSRVVDILVADRNYRSLAGRCEVTRIGREEVPLVSLDDLIKMKESAGRRQDRSDARLLRKIREIRRGKNGREA